MIINVEEDKRFRRDGDDLICEVPISFSQAALGAETQAPCLHGEQALKIPAGTQTHKVFRISGRGMPSVRDASKFGDLYVRVIVYTPQKLTDRQRELLAELAEVSDEVPTLQSQRKGFFNHIRESFDQLKRDVMG